LYNTELHVTVTEVPENQALLWYHCQELQGYLYLIDCMNGE